jgi:hypothetical protein
MDVCTAPLRHLGDRKGVALLLIRRLPFQLARPSKRQREGIFNHELLTGPPHAKTLVDRKSICTGEDEGKKYICWSIEADIEYRNLLNALHAIICSLPAPKTILC